MFNRDLEELNNRNNSSKKAITQEQIKKNILEEKNSRIIEAEELINDQEIEWQKSLQHNRIKKK